MLATRLSVRHILSPASILVLYFPYEEQQYNHPDNDTQPLFLQRDALPLVSIGRSIIATNAANMRPPDAYTGALGFASPP